MTSFESDVIIAAVVACFILQTVTVVMCLGKWLGGVKVNVSDGKAKRWCVPDIPNTPRPPRPRGMGGGWFPPPTTDPPPAPPPPTTRPAKLPERFTAYWLEVTPIDCNDDMLPITLYWDNDHARREAHDYLLDNTDTVASVAVVRVTITRDAEVMR